MKRLNIIILFIVLVNFNSFGQCQNCPPPKLCTIITFNIPGCPSDLHAELCYECSPTHPDVMNVEVSRLSNICPGYEIQAYTYAINYIYDHVGELCGQVPCDQKQKELNIIIPLCMYIEFDFDTGYLDLKDNNCGSKCYQKSIWCWCNCTPDCDPDPNCIPHSHNIIIERHTDGNDCPLIKLGVAPYTYDHDWIIPCAKIEECTVFWPV